MPGKRKSLSEPSTDCAKFKKIIGQRTRGDKTYYNVQWKGRSLKTWELEENLSPEKVAEFKRSNQPAGQSSSSSNDLAGCLRHLEPKQIIGMYEVDDKIMFKMTFEGSIISDFVPVEEAKLQCPQLVIEYYEKQIKWVNDDVKS